MQTTTDSPMTNPSTTDYVTTGTQATTESEATTDMTPAPDSDGRLLKQVMWILNKQDSEIDGQTKKVNVRFFSLLLAKGDGHLESKSAQRLILLKLLILVVNIYMFYVQNISFVILFIDL